jgi:multiple sugar transport system permease protein
MGRGGGSQARERRQAYLLTAPAVAVLVGVALYPVLGAFWLSPHRFILVFGERRWVGLENYAFMLRTPPRRSASTPTRR